MNAIILSLDQWFKACAVVKNGNFRASDMTGSSLGPNQKVFFSSNQQFLNFQSFFFFFSEISCWTSLASFSTLSFDEVSL